MLYKVSIERIDGHILTEIVLDITGYNMVLWKQCLQGYIRAYSITEVK